MTHHPLITVQKLVADTLNKPFADIDPDVPVTELGLGKKYHNIFAAAARAHRVDMDAIRRTMPAHTIKRGELVMKSLADMAVISPKAAQLLARYTTQVPLDTITTMAQSIQTGRYVAGTQMSGPLHRPSSPYKVVAKYSTLCLLTFYLWPAAILLAVSILPGLADMYRSYRHEKYWAELTGASKAPAPDPVFAALTSQPSPG